MAGQLVLLLAVAVSGALALPAPELAGGLRLASAVIGAALVAAGGWLVLRGLAGLGPNLVAVPYPRRGGHLVETGIYARLRHPIYAGIVAGSIGWGLLAASLLTFGLAILLGAWFDLKARREERWLAEAYPSYAAYAARTRRFLPGVY